MTDTGEKRINNDPSQTRALRDIFRFFLFMALAGMLARGAAGAAMPVVTAAAPYYGSVSRTFSVPSTIISDTGEPFLLPEGLLIERVCVQPGDYVHAGDTLIQFDTISVSEAIALGEAELGQLRMQYARLMEAKAADPFSLEQAQAVLTRAQENADRVRMESENALAQAQAVCGAAEERVAELEKQMSEAAQDEALSQAYAQAQAEWEQAKAALQTTQEQSAREADAASAQLKTAKATYESERHRYELEQASLNESNAENRQSAAVLSVQVDQRKREMEVLSRVQTQGNVYTAPKDGVLTQCALKAGEKSPLVGGLIAQLQEAPVVRAALTEEQAQSVKTGDAVMVRQGGISRQAIITFLETEAQTGSRNAKIQLPAAEWQFGTAELTFTVQSESAGLCLPAYAINADRQGTFVYLIEEKNTVLGIQNTLVRLAVAVEGRGDGVVQVSGALDAESRVAADSTKPLSVGAKVRIRV